MNCLWKMRPVLGGIKLEKAQDAQRSIEAKLQLLFHI